MSQSSQSFQLPLRRRNSPIRCRSAPVTIPRQPCVIWGLQCRLC